MKTIEFIISEADIEAFAHVSGDFNPVHLDQEYAKVHGFPNRISHGLLTMGKVWSVLSSHFLKPNDLPYSYEMKFIAPVFVGDTVTLSINHVGDKWTIKGVCAKKPIINATILIKQ
ncbi:hypothetical protein HHO41_08945 [Bacillus sp. DNRA2]|uniref:MaoC/PaaZ C-terminal domain-containing protein n=1 Tax=Bacillus sp. DNRA2 TaxID=2723053 RepID=UPI00145C4BDC|nr:MaoC/PaaZ C-terminal domain-containing protein [Bacillus sp. DNRA2]NMD70420.1 hypothetical protein [Bacillus sp. DNRA2]